MITDDRLQGWLCFVLLNRHCADLGAPEEVSRMFLERGWICYGEDRQLVVTAEGKAAADLAAPEWGIDPINAT